MAKEPHSTHAAHRNIYTPKCPDPGDRPDAHTGGRIQWRPHPSSVPIVVATTTQTHPDATPPGTRHPLSAPQGSLDEEELTENCTLPIPEGKPHIPTLGEKRLTADGYPAPKEESPATRTQGEADNKDVRRVTVPHTNINLALTITHEQPPKAPTSLMTQPSYPPQQTSTDRSPPIKQKPHHTSIDSLPPLHNSHTPTTQIITHKAL
jgi:hypothetical protein